MVSIIVINSFNVYFVMDIRIDFSNKRTIAGIIVLVCIMGIVAYSPRLVSLTNPDVCTIDGVCQHEKRVDFLTDSIPVFIFAGIVIGALVFFFMSSRLDAKEKDLSKVTSVLVSFLNKDEKQVVQKILDNEGKILQAEVSRLEGLGKVKSHRILQRLLDRGVVEKESFGKTNIIKLNKEIKETLLAKK